MEGTVTARDDRMEYEVREGAWEIIHVIVFYVSAALAILATAGVARVPTGISCIVLLIYSMFAIVSSPTYVIIDPVSRGVMVERYHYYLPSRHQIPADELESILVMESARPPAEGDDKSSKRDLSYFVRIYLGLKDGGRLKLFRSRMTGAPLENRNKAFLIAEGAAKALDIPVIYASRGKQRDAEDLRFAEPSADER